jgi:uncharacterized membrane protein YcjF (UPF0283 family)
MKQRNLFTTKTILGAWGMLFGFAIAVAPTQLISDFLDRKFDKNRAADIKFYIALVVTCSGFFGTNYGRWKATDDVRLPFQK